MSTARHFLLVILLSLISSCGHLPAMKTLDPVVDQATMDVCESPYVKTPYRFVHTIEATLPGGRTATLIGVTLVDPPEKVLHSVLMTLEGLVLFDGESNKGTLHVNRALSPFDQAAVAQNMMEDVRLLFLAPENPALEAGVLEDGATFCRSKGNAGETVEVLIRSDHTWKLETHVNPFQRLREVTATALNGSFPGELELKGNAYGNYTLRLKLISVEPVSGKSSLTETGEGPDNE